jgi:hypothetical protein
MATLDSGSRLTYAQLKAHLRGIALAWQNLASKVGDDFLGLKATGYLANTVLRNADIAIDGTTTGLLGLTSASALKFLTPRLDAIRKKLTAQFGAGTTEMMVALGYADYAKGLLQAFGPGHDDTYASFWTAYAALYTAGEYVPGEVCDLLTAVGVRTDPDYCHPPANKWLATITITGPAAGVLTTRDTIDPTIYRNHTAEIYVTARAGSPDSVGITISDAKDEDDTPTDTGATDFTVTVADTKVATEVVDIAQTDSFALCSTEDSSLTITGGKSGDIFEVRVKSFVAMADPT